MKHLPWAVFALALAQACGDGKHQVADRATATDTIAAAEPADALTDLAPYDLPLTVRIPPAQITAGATPELGWNEDEGWFGVRAGDHFAIRITEEPGDVARLKTDLDRDLVRKHTVITETPELLVYQSRFPDDPSLVFVHFYRVLHVGERTFVVENDPQGRFNATDIERMRTAVDPDLPA